jgi:hypothetical protein
LSVLGLALNLVLNLMPKLKTDLNGYG